MSLRYKALAAVVVLVTAVTGGVLLFVKQRVEADTAEIIQDDLAVDGLRLKEKLHSEAERVRAAIASSQYCGIAVARCDCACLAASNNNALQRFSPARLCRRCHAAASQRRNRAWMSHNQRRLSARWMPRRYRCGNDNARWPTALNSACVGDSPRAPAQSGKGMDSACSSA